MKHEFKHEDLIESTRFDPLQESEKFTMDVLLENTESEHQRLVNEGTLSGDIAQFTPILSPLVRRLFPGLIANHILGVQTMKTPTAYIYALTNRYVGTDNNRANPNNGAQIVEADATLTLVEGDTALGGTVLYVEGNKALISGATVTVGDTINTDKTVTGIYSNEAAFSRILKGYTGSYTTAQAEQLGKDMREVGFDISRKSVEAVSHALKGQYSVEMYQDLKAQHGLLADEEIMNLMNYELSAEIDRKCVDFVNDNATQLSDTTFSGVADVKGRWEIEQYRTQAIRLSKESAQIGLDTKRGQGNIILTSPKVVTMLEQVGAFKAADSNVNLKQPISGGVAGTYDGRFKVVVDQYATSDYATVMYKGQDRRDAMGFFAPYVPVSFTRVTHADSGQPAVIAKTRYALDTIPGVSSATSNDRAKAYARSFGINFANTVLA